jgi:phospholipid/cholesterol/gamma-HCH transport system substrate-binding protein
VFISLFLSAGGGTAELITERNLIYNVLIIQNYPNYLIHQSPFMRKETKIAIFAIATLALAIWGYKYLKGFNILSQNITIYATYNRIDGLRISTPVYINGMQVGLVADFFQKPDDVKTITVEMVLDKDVKLPPSTRAELVTTSLMGGTAVNIAFEGSCSGNDCLKDGAYVPGVYKGVLASFATPEEVGVYMDELSKGLHTVLDTLSNRISENKELNTSVQDVQVILANLKSTTGRLDRVMAASSGSIEGSLKNIESITGSLKESNAQIKSILANVDAISGDVKDADIKKLVGETRQTMEKLQGTLSNSDKAITDLSALLQNLNKGDGTIGLLLNDKEFADNLQVTLKNIDLLMRDVRLHPERYRRILSKKKLEYEYEPLENDPAFKKGN